MAGFGFLALALLASSLTSRAFAQQEAGEVRGRVTDALSNQPLVGATLAIKGTAFGAVTDLDGNYIVAGVPAGLYNLEVSYIGYRRQQVFEVPVSAAKPAIINIALEENPAGDSLGTVVIQDAAFYRNSESPVSLRSIGVNEIQRNPGGNRDISKAVQSLPGVASSVAFRNDIIIRGGSPSENRFYLDGVEVPNINHFATQGASGGPVGLINIDLIREVNFYSGAFPANRGNSLSSVFEFQTKDARTDRVAFRGIIGSSDIGLLAEGPLGKKGTFLISARRSYLQFLFRLIGLSFLPTYNDAQVKYKLRINQRNELTFVGLGGYDQFALNLEADSTEQQRYDLSTIPQNGQWNYTNGLVYKHFRDAGQFTFVLSRNMLNNTAIKYRNNDDSKAENLNLDYRSREIENKFRFEFTARPMGMRLNVGTSAEYAKYTEKTFNNVYTPIGLIQVRSNSFLEVYKAGIFGQLSRDFFETRLKLSLGLRTDMNGYNANMRNPLNQISPRFSASYQVTERVAISFNAGRYFQLPGYTAMGYRENDGTLLNAVNGLKYIRNDQLVGGVEYVTKNSLKASVEGFYKKYDNYPFLVREQISLANQGADFGVVGNAPITSTSQGRAYGVEFLVQQKLYKGFFGIVAYTFVRSEFTDGSGQYRPSAWDNRHIVALTGGKVFKRGWELGSKFRVLGSTPYTPFDTSGSLLMQSWDANQSPIRDYTRLNQGRIGTFSQLDVRIDKKWSFSNRFSLNLYLDIQNVLNTKLKFNDVLDTERDTDKSSPTYGQPLADPNRPGYYRGNFISNATGQLLPTVGVIVDF